MKMIYKPLDYTEYYDNSNSTMNSLVINNYKKDINIFNLKEYMQLQKKQCKMKEISINDNEFNNEIIELPKETINLSINSRCFNKSLDNIAISNIKYLTLHAEYNRQITKFPKNLKYFYVPFLTIKNFTLVIPKMVKKVILCDKETTTSDHSKVMTLSINTIIVLHLYNNLDIKNIIKNYHMMHDIHYIYFKNNNIPCNYVNNINDDIYNISLCNCKNIKNTIGKNTRKFSLTNNNLHKNYVNYFINLPQKIVDLTIILNDANCCYSEHKHNKKNTKLTNYLPPINILKIYVCTQNINNLQNKLHNLDVKNCKKSSKLPYSLQYIKYNNFLIKSFPFNIKEISVLSSNLNSQTKIINKNKIDKVTVLYPNFKEFRNCDKNQIQCNIIDIFPHCKILNLEFIKSLCSYDEFAELNINALKEEFFNSCSNLNEYTDKLTFFNI
jgi:hypothetical protein